MRGVPRLAFVRLGRFINATSERNVSVFVEISMTMVDVDRNLTASTLSSYIRLYPSKLNVS